MSSTDREQDRAASLSETLKSFLGVAQRLVNDPVLAPYLGNWREPAAASEEPAPRNAAAEAPAAPATSPLATRVLTALMDMPDAEFLLMANKVMNRYYAAVAGLAPDGVDVGVMCIYCHMVQTHRVCAKCFAERGAGPTDYDG